MKTLTEYIKETKENAALTDDFVYIVKDNEGCIIQICDTEEDAKKVANDFSKEETVKTTIEKTKRSEIEEN